MRITGLARRWAALAALVGALGVVLPAGPALANWPHANPGQPLLQAPRVCMPNIVPINHRCRVVDFTPLAVLDGRPWYYAFYATHWADRHGRKDRGFPVLLYLEQPATLRLGLWVNDAPGLDGRWAATPPPRPVLIRREDEVYMGLTLHNVGETPDQRLFRLTGERWAQIKILRRSAGDQAMIDAATPRGCSVGGDGLFDWPAFQVALPLRTDLTGSPCGVLVASLAVRGDHTVLTEVKAER
ncbi:MAG: hypothetical protein P4L73_20240 [Caulobacteraceae bacterium]|nr:hypothetical protein [Caulobacteraceae bacterium]